MRPSRLIWLLGGAAWIALLTGGWLALLRHDLTPGIGGQVPAAWPAGSRLPLVRGQPALVFFAHRNCPCTRTSLEELRYVLETAPRPANVLVVLVEPADATADRVGSEIASCARTLPGANVVIDAAGVEARRFHVRTSGHLLLYDEQGRLQFSGGITAARGHAGASGGRRAVLAWLRKEAMGQRTAPVFGCSLFADEDEGEEEAQSWNP